MTEVTATFQLTYLEFKEKGKRMQNHLKTMLEEVQSGKAQLYDIREEGEWNEGHLKIAKLIPLSTLREYEVPKGEDSAKKTYLHCRSGQRVQMAAPILEEIGFTEVIPLSEGFQELSDEGFEEA